MHISEETNDYLNRLTPFLSHLPADEQSELLEELVIHLESVRDVADASGGLASLDRLVGDPASFVAEYCETAGIPRGPAASDARNETAGSYRQRADGPVTSALNNMLRAVAAVNERVSAREQWSSFFGFLPELTPAWWVLRAVLLTMLLGQVFGGDGAARIGSLPVPKLFGSVVVGLAFAAWLAKKSVAYGRRPNKAGWLKGANAVVAGICLLVATTIAFAAAEPFDGGEYHYDSHPAHAVIDEPAWPAAPEAPQVEPVGGPEVARFEIQGPDGRLFSFEGVVRGPAGHEMNSAELGALLGLLNGE